MHALHVQCNPVANAYMVAAASNPVFAHGNGIASPSAFDVAAIGPIVMQVASMRHACFVHAGQSGL